MTEKITIRTLAAPVILTVRSSEPVVARVSANDDPRVTVLGQPGPRGAKGDRGPDPWLDPIQSIQGNDALAIDYALGKHVRLTLTGNINSFSVSNWPAPDRIARLTLDILNSGDFDILAWPAGTLWQSQSVPQITRGAGARDRIILSTTDGGTTIFGDPVGFDYR